MARVFKRYNYGHNSARPRNAFERQHPWRPKTLKTWKHNMTRHYYTSYIGPDSQPCYRCILCQFDTFSEAGMHRHLEFSKLDHAPRSMPSEDIPVTEWIAEQGVKRYLGGLQLDFGLLTWNTREASTLAAKAILREQDFLRAVGVSTRLYWFDNGSTDGTVEALQSLFAADVWSELEFCNIGQSLARNWILRSAHGAHCLMMVDSDVVIVPYSSYSLARYMYLEHGTIPACVGLMSANCSPNPEEAATRCTEIQTWMVQDDPSIAWTQYGLFDMAFIRKHGIKFDESPVFCGPGWGFEDDDFNLQIIKAGGKCLNTKYFRYIHSRNKSLELIGYEQAVKIHALRRDYMVAKWSPVLLDPIQAKIKQLANACMPPLTRKSKPATV